MKLIMENWREYLKEDSNEKSLLENRSAYEYQYEKFIITEDLLLEGLFADAWTLVKTKIHQAKAWSYEKYVRMVKPLITTIKGWIKKLRQSGAMKKYAARFRIQELDLLATKKYITFGYALLSMVVKVIGYATAHIKTGGLKLIANILFGFFSMLDKLAQDDPTEETGFAGPSKQTQVALTAFCEFVDLPCDEIIQLTSQTRSFGKDLKKTWDPMDTAKLGQGEFVAAENKTI